jgi:hypothetical protein
MLLVAGFISQHREGTFIWEPSGDCKLTIYSALGPLVGGSPTGSGKEAI